MRPDLSRNCLRPWWTSDADLSGRSCYARCCGRHAVSIRPAEIQRSDFPGLWSGVAIHLPVQQNFEYAYANQGNLTIERSLTKDMTLSGSYIFVGAHHLPHPLDVNAPRTDLQIQNFFRLSGRNPVSTTEAVAFSIPTSGAPCPGGVPLQCFTMTTPTGAAAYATAGQTFAIIVPGMITAPLANLGSRIVNAGVANFFRPYAPNYFLAQALSGGLVTPTVLNGALAGSLLEPSPLVQSTRKLQMHPVTTP